jgi:hypothetical protein
MTSKNPSNTASKRIVSRDHFNQRKQAFSPIPLLS